AWRRGRGMSIEGVVREARTIEISEPHADVNGPGATAASLSPREREVALLVARGHTNRQIATELQTGVRTVDKHVSNILRKLKFTSRTQLRLWVADQGIPAVK
ncbi:MAG: helix-turn-helix transcriptional regulator, partial [Chloroflexia bacterium]|nr:helix-turn-helix transcriptional regulator [Chloroflexia bacterium]